MQTQEAMKFFVLYKIKMPALVRWHAGIGIDASSTITARPVATTRRDQLTVPFSRGPCPCSFHCRGLFPCVHVCHDRRRVHSHVGRSSVARNYGARNHRRH